tara:strand:+ start:156 stop:977 length:822 start_codon:yes stop_codon:yes gene_type:complete
MKVFINTIPHSGTHFIVSILEAFGFKHSTFNYSFYTIKPFFRINQKRGINWRSAYLLQNVLSIKPKEIPVSVSSPRNITQSTYKNLFKNLNNQEFIIGHVPFSKKASDLNEKNIDRVISITRDPRDMVLSMMRHIKDRSQHHAHRYLFKELDNDQERFNQICKGYQNEFGYMCGIKKMYESILEWEKFSKSKILKFEEIIGPQGGGDVESQINSINDLSNFLGLEFNEEEIIEISNKAFGNSTTFRGGRINGWKSFLTDEQNKFFESEYHKLL